MVAFGYRFGPVGRLLGVALLVVALDACADGNMTPGTMNSAAPLAVRDASPSRGTILAIRPTEAGVAGAGRPSTAHRPRGVGRQKVAGRTKA